MSCFFITNFQKELENSEFLCGAQFMNVACELLGNRSQYHAIEVEYELVIFIRW